MRGRLRSLSSHRRIPIGEGWGVRGPDAPPPFSSRTRAQVPGTVASAFRTAGLWTLDAPQVRFDEYAWHFDTRFELGELPPGGRRVLGFDGLATLAEVFVDGVSVLRSTNMFRQYELDISQLGVGAHELVIRCAPLQAALEQRRPRPRWRTPMVVHQQLRWFRTTLLGRTPGWSPPASAVGPWREVWIEDRHWVDLSNVQVVAEVVDGRGVLRVAAALHALGGSTVAGGVLRLRRGNREWSGPLSKSGDSATIQASLTLDDPELWWPHTHGDPACYEASLELELPGGQRPIVAELGPVGFRTLELEAGGDEFSLRINGEKVFCRGACWTPLDPVTLQTSEGACADTLELVRTAGMNMIRVGGTMVYESQAFYDLCDRKGILVWQDLMFANMDYPQGDAAFVADATQEVRERLSAIAGSPSLALVCGNSEGAQQAAMWGAGRESWAPTLFHETFAQACREHCPGTAYWPSSATNGPFPHAPRSGPSSYYGVGAYLRPPEDARRSEVRFASECLAFANVPDDETLRLVPDNGGFRSTHPRWKERVPRDLGAGWDFDDVRDHYLREYYGLDPVQLRYAEPERYLHLSRLVSGRVMADAMEEWRRGRSLCHGALIWFLRDLWPGAGWGVIDSQGKPKAAWYALARSLQPVTVFFSDEGLNGLAVHVINESSRALDLGLELSLFRTLESTARRARLDLRLAPREVREIPCTDLLDGFIDVTHAYRFGPPPYSLALAELKTSDGEALARSRKILVRDPQEYLKPANLGLTAVLAVGSDGEARLELTTRRFAHGIYLEADGWVSDDQYFDLAPGETRVLRIARPVSIPAQDWAPAVVVRACNGDGEVHARSGA